MVCGRSIRYKAHGIRLQVTRQGLMVGYANSFALYAAVAFAAIPLMLLVKIKNKTRATNVLSGNRVMLVLPMISAAKFSIIAASIAAISLLACALNSRSARRNRMPRRGFGRSVSAGFRRPHTERCRSGC